MERMSLHHDTMSFDLETLASSAPVHASTCYSMNPRRRRSELVSVQPLAVDVMPYRVEYASTGRATCKGPKPCSGSKIEKNELRLGSLTEIQGHTVCMVH